MRDEPQEVVALLAPPALSELVQKEGLRMISFVPCLQVVGLPLHFLVALMSS
jgi:hypothetical protein